jgi:hypothetical protein
MESERDRDYPLALEIGPLFADTIVHRWQAFGGEGTRNAATNRLFNELET